MLIGHTMANCTDNAKRCGERSGARCCRHFALCNCFCRILLLVFTLEFALCGSFVLHGLHWDCFRYSCCCCYCCCRCCCCRLRCLLLAAAVSYLYPVGYTAPRTHLCLLARVHFHFISVIAKLFVLNIFFSVLFACRAAIVSFRCLCCCVLLLLLFLVVFALCQTCLLPLFLVLYAPVAIIALVSFMASASIKMFAFAYKQKPHTDMHTYICMYVRRLHIVRPTFPAGAGGELQIDMQFEPLIAHTATRCSTLRWLSQKPDPD